jgi:NADP-dependent 3-hydroxy acid dehydrogenase YdfG
MTDIEKTVLVTGASRGFGRAIAIAFFKAGARVVAVARSREQLEQLRAELGESVDRGRGCG